MSCPFQAIVFDFDYTLADSSKGIVECVNYALAELRLPVVAAERIYPLIGLSLKDMFVELEGAQDGSRADEFARLFIQRADQVMAELTIIYDWVPGTIAHLRSLGFSLGIVSTKFRYRIEAILRRERLLEAFGIIVGGEDVAEFKPHPEGLFKAIEGLGSTPASSLYVGDSLTDAKTAARAAVLFVAVLSGVTPRGDFEPLPIHAILKNVAELPHALERMCH